MDQTWSDSSPTVQGLVKADPFWTDDPQILIKNLDIFPNQTMNNAERLNSLTRLLIIITVGMFLTGYEHAFTTFALGIILIVLLRYNQPKEHFGPHRGNPDPCRTCGHNSTMAYINTKYETSPLNQTVHQNFGPNSWIHSKYNVIPIETPAPAREIWQNQPKYYNEYSQNPTGYTIIDNGTTYGDSYNEHSNWQNQSVPSPRRHFASQEWVENTSNGVLNSYPRPRESAMPAIQSSWMRNSLEFRNNWIGEIVDQFNQERNHNCLNIRPGRATW